MIDISVVIPIYKGRKYLEYLTHILNRNFENFEIKYGLKCEGILVNDYPEEKLEIEEKITHIHIYNLEENRGIHGARVFGYFKAEGNYIVFLDQDDKISENYLVSQRKNIGTADVIICNGYQERLCMRGRRKIYSEKDQLAKIENLFDHILEKNCIRSPGQALIKKKAIPELWLSEVMTENGADDYFLWIVMAKNGCTFSINTDCLYSHIENGENASNRIESMKSSLKEMITILERNEVLSSAQLQELQKKHSMRGNADFNKIVRTYDYWMYLHIRDKKIENYLCDRGYKKIAIYGMNYLGNRLYDDLCESFVEVIFGIDKASDGIEYEIPIFNMEDMALYKKLEEIDAVIVTVVTSYQSISQKFKKMSHKPVISIEDILIEMINQSDNRIYCKGE